MTSQSIPIRNTGSNAAVSEPVSDVGKLSQWHLIRMRFIRNRLAVIGLAGLAIMYLMIILADFLAPNSYLEHDPDYVFGPPSAIMFRSPGGEFGLFMRPMQTELDPQAFKFVFKPSEDIVVPIRFFVRGDRYTFLGLIATDLHFIGVEQPYRLYLLGADPFGRDMFARVLHGGQVSLTVGWIGVFFTILFGTVLGTASGYFGGIIDDIMQRIIEIIMSFPTIPLWAALAAILPPISADFTAVHRYFLITVILSLVSWTGLARQLRAKVMSYRQADFTQAALAAGASEARIVFTHMIPNALSHIIVVAALAIPSMILGETSLSFLGLGILPPMVSWGALLKDAQQVSTVIEHPWLMVPGIAVILTVLFFSFLGDALRDAVDPYSI